MMKAWEDILNTSIVGTDRKQFNRQLLPDDLSLVIEQAEKSADEKEIQFLNTASVIYAYRRAALIPSQEDVTVIPVCENEHRKYISAEAVSSLHAVLSSENDALLLYWLLQCRDKNEVVTPDFIPVLFEKAATNGELQPLIVECTGVRGLWMQQFNDEWSFTVEINVKEIFDHGKQQERKWALLEWRKDDPLEALQALINTWPQEQATVKTDFLGALDINHLAEDIPFLEDVFQEKSVKVKEVALILLKRRKTSFIVNEVWEFLKTLFTVKKSGGVFGLLSKEVLEFNLSFEIPDQFKKYGITTLDATKEFSEKEFTISKMIEFIPTSNWEEHLQMSGEQVLELFSRKEETKKYIPSFAIATDTFLDLKWSLLLYNKYDIACYRTIPHLERKVQEQIAIDIFKDVQDIYDVVPGREIEWSLDFTMDILEKTAQEPFIYTRAWYKNLIHHFPVAVVDKLNGIEVADGLKVTYWNNISEEIKRLLTIKQQINQSF